MPTGYTADIKDGISFKTYAMNCARAFGACVTEIDVGYLSRLRAYANVNPGRDKLRRLGLRRVVAYELLKTPNVMVSGLP